ncbi:MAG: hypothetical protein Q4D64_05095 [Prevotellaceae bacterium]|nr:hypothetical protein [Prevotellaceae bacterium]
MRKFYYLFLTMLLGMVGMTANAQDITVTVNVDDASRLEVYWTETDYSTSPYATTRHDIEAENNVFTAQVPNYTTLTFECKDGNLFTSFMVDNTEETNAKYKTSYDKYFYSSATVDIKTDSESNVRTEVCNITIEDEPSQVTAQVKGSYTVFNSFENKTTQYKFIPDFETAIDFNGVGNTPLYSVKYNDTEITKTGSYYTVTFDENTNEHNIVINKNAPAGTQQNIKLSYANSDKGKGFVTKVLVDNIEISSDEYLKAEGFKVNWGAKVDIYGDVDNYRVNGVTINSESTNFGSSIALTATSDYEVVMDVEPYPAITFELTVNDASLVNVQKATYTDYGYGYGNWSYSSNIKIEDGTHTVSVADKDDTPYIYISGNADCASLKVSVGGVEQEELSEGGYRFKAVEGMKVSVEATPIIRNKKLIVYINDITKTYYGNAYLESGVYPNTRSVYLENGYNEIYFYDGEQFSVGVNAASLYKYKNGESFTDYYYTPTDGDVLKFYVSSDNAATAPTTNNVTFTLDSKLAASDVTVTYDRVKTLSDLTAGLSAFAGTEVAIAANGSAAIEVKVNDVAITANAEGNYVFTVSAATAVEINKSTGTGINNINAENADNSFYTLQGVKVNGKAKGLYIKNGKKVVVK